MNEEELLQKLREAFKMESEERLANILSNLIELEKAASPEETMPIVETVFREAHSLKGAARAVNLANIEMLCQAIESIFASLKRNEFSVSRRLFDSLHDAVRAIENALAASGSESVSQSDTEIAELVSRLDNLKLQNDNIREITDSYSAEFTVPVEKDDSKEDGEEPVSVGESRNECAPFDDRDMESRHLEDAKKPLITDTVRISTARLDSLLLESEEIASLKLVSSQRLVNLREVAQAVHLWNKNWSRVEADYRILRNQFQKDRDGDGRDGSPLSKLLDFMEWHVDHVRFMTRALGVLTKESEQDHRTLSRMVDEHLDGMKKVMMMPFSTLFAVLPRMVRDLCRDREKDADIFIDGAEIEIDRRILEELKDPMIHLLRNAVDHGLEKPDARREIGKPGRGMIQLKVSRAEGSKVEIRISDDGRGIDIARIRDVAIKSGLVSEKEAAGLEDGEFMPFIFRSGISSSPIITEISGRGLGLAIVQEKVEKLGGLISMESEPGKGTSFLIQLPVTLATFRGVLVKAGGDCFVVPGSHVERVLKIKPDRVKTVENNETVAIDEEVLSLSDLADTLRLKRKGENGGKNQLLTIIVLGSGQNKVAFKVSEVICEQEVLVKSLGKQLTRVPNIAGATILGTGKVVPILSVHDLLKSSRGTGLRKVAGVVEEASEPKDTVTKQKSVLVAEDSITSRILLKNILEAAGYRVKTAIDGRDAYTAIKTEKFDIVVSDVEMPRMNGFELTANIRNTDKIGNTPVILVTSLDSREDREKGIDAGANAYIVKGSFDQSNLLDVIERLT